MLKFLHLFRPEKLLQSAVAVVWRFPLTVLALFILTTLWCVSIAERGFFVGFMSLMVFTSMTLSFIVLLSDRNSTLCIYTKHTQVIDQLMKLFHVIPTYLKFTSMASFSKKSLLTDQGWSVYKVIRKSNLGYPPTLFYSDTFTFKSSSNRASTQSINSNFYVRQFVL